MLFPHQKATPNLGNTEFFSQPLSVSSFSIWEVSSIIVFYVFESIWIISLSPFPHVVRLTLLDAMQVTEENNMLVYAEYSAALGLLQENKSFLPFGHAIIGFFVISSR